MKLILLCALISVLVLTFHPTEAHARIYTKPTLAEQFQTRAAESKAASEARALAYLQATVLATAQRLATTEVDFADLVRYGRLHTV